MDVDVPFLFAALANGAWRPGIGDPTWLGWFTVAAYLSAAWASGHAFVAGRGRAHDGWRQSPRFWLALCVLLVILGINKQLDFQTALTQIGRRLAFEQGWYDSRRGVQLGFIIGVAAIGLAFIGLVILTAARAPRDRLLALAGMVFLAVFVVIRASSFHHVDQFLGLSVAGLKWNAILELSGIACVGLAAVWSHGRPRQEPDSKERAEMAHRRSLVKEMWKL